MERLPKRPLAVRAKSLALPQTGALELHVCELVAGPDGCERCPTGALATCDLWDNPKYRTAYVPM